MVYDLVHLRSHGETWVMRSHVINAKSDVEALVKANKFLQQGEKLDGLRRLPVRLHKTQVVKRWRKWRKSAGP